MVVSSLQYHGKLVFLVLMLSVQSVRYRLQGCIIHICTYLNDIMYDICIPEIQTVSENSFLIQVSYSPYMVEGFQTVLPNVPYREH